MSMVSDGSLELPRGWVATTLQSVCQILDSRRIPVNKRERSRRIEGKAEGELYPYYGATGKVGVIDDFLFEGEHVLLGEDGAPFLDPFKVKSYLADGKFWVNNHAHILKSTISHRYLFHYLNQIDYSDHVTGTTRLKLTQHSLKRIPVLVAPTNEQLRIVAKIDDLVSEIDKGIGSLKTAKRQLEEYRKSVLKNAFEGKLTAQWRSENNDMLETPEQLLTRIKREQAARYEEQLNKWKRAVEGWKKGGRSGKKPLNPTKPKQISRASSDETQSLPTLSKGWSYCHLGHAIDDPKYGTAKKCEYNYEGTGVLRIPNVIGGAINTSDLKGAEFDENEKQIYALETGDILLIRSNGSIAIVGSCALISKADEKYLFAGYLIRLRSNPKVLLPEYLSALLSSHLLRTQIEYKAKSTSGVNNINSGEIRSLIIPLCSLREQQVVVERLSSILSATNAVVSEIDNCLLKVEALRQSILKRAFSGQLVLQDPNDEPASVLLDRIKAERKQRAKSGMDRRRTRKERATA